MITLSIVIVNYNVCGFLEQCLLSVRDAVKGISHEIFVVDNASTDGSEAYISTRFPQVKYIYNTENVGFSKANNQAIAQSSGRYVLLLNPDTVVGESVLDEACHFLDEHDDAGALGVKMIDGDGKFLPESKLMDNSIYPCCMFLHRGSRSVKFSACPNCSHTVAVSDVIICGFSTRTVHTESTYSLGHSCC